MNIVFGTTFGIMILTVIYIHLKYLRERSKLLRGVRSTLGDSPADTDFVIVNYKGERLPMTMWEKLNVWDFMDRGQKREASMAIKKGIKKGKLRDNILGRDAGLEEFTE